MQKRQAESQQSPKQQPRKSQKGERINKGRRTGAEPKTDNNNESTQSKVVKKVPKAKKSIKTKILCKRCSEKFESKDSYSAHKTNCKGKRKRKIKKKKSKRESENEKTPKKRSKKISQAAQKSDAETENEADVEDVDEDEEDESDRRRIVSGALEDVVKELEKGESVLIKDTSISTSDFEDEEEKRLGADSFIVDSLDADVEIVDDVFIDEEVDDQPSSSTPDLVIDHGKDPKMSIDFCPACSAVLDPAKGGYSVNLSTREAKVTCAVCAKVVVIKAAFTQSQVERLV